MLFEKKSVAEKPSKKMGRGSVVWRGGGKAASAINHRHGPRNFRRHSAQLKNNPPSEIAGQITGILGSVLI